jgi:hypothetical protein
VSRKSVLSLSLILLCGAAAHAGTVYIPLPGYSLVGTTAWEPLVQVSNGGAQSANFKQLFLRSDSDGTIRPPVPTSQALAGLQSTGLAPEPGSQGLLELSGPDGFSFSARLQRVDNDDATELPVISSENAAAAGDSLYLQDLRRSATVVTDWTILNLGWTSANCKISAFSVNGTAIGAPATLVLKPLSSRVFTDVLQTLGITEGEYVRGAVSCDQSFYSFAMARDAATGDVGLIEPSGRGNSGLVLPGQGGNGNTGCPAGGACFEVKGLAFKPSKSVPVKRFSFPVPPGNYERIHFEMDVKHGGWDPANRSGKHMLFWLVKNRNYYMYGYANFEGPSKNDVIFRHGVAITHPEKIKIISKIAAQEGHTYHLEYTYDTRQNFLKLDVSENGTVLATINGTPNTNVIDFATGDLGIIDIGFDGSNPAERPTYGWEYSNLEIQWLK